MSRDDSFFQQKGKSWYKQNFYNVTLATNIAIWRHLANRLFQGDLTRIIWSSPEMMFRKRQQQVASLIQQGNKDSNVGILDFPFCAFRLNQDSHSVNSDRIWFNQALNTKGMWIEELGRYIRLTPATLDYTAVFVCQNDYDLQYASNVLLWDDSNETLVESFLDTTDDQGKEHTIKNIVVYSSSTHMNPEYTDSDWIEKNKIQTIRIDIPCQTWILNEDRHNYWLTKKVIFEFLADANIPYTETIPIEDIINKTFGDN